MEFEVFIGVDVSKLSLDYCMIIKGENVFSSKSDNTEKGIKALLEKLIEHTSVNQSKWLFCMEHTGIYCKPLLNILLKKNISIWLENALKIKVFHSLERGKNDALDAYRIASYAYFKKEQAKLWKAPRRVIAELKSILSIRKRLLATKKTLQVSLNEEEWFGDQVIYRAHKETVSPVITMIDKQIKKVELEIDLIVAKDAQVKKMTTLLTSITGIGKIVAANTIVATNEFVNINCPKKMACHCGVAPFQYSSGTSIRGKAKVSHRANKQMKALLHLAAMSAISCKGELSDYYQRKVNEGKNKMLVLNAVRNKLIHRMFACVKNNRKYDKNYTHVLV